MHVLGERAATNLRCNTELLCAVVGMATGLSLEFANGKFERLVLGCIDADFCK